VNHRKLVKIKNVSKVNYGLGQPPKLSESGIPIIRATNINHGKITDKDMIYSELENLPLERAPLLQEGEILVVRSGAYTGDSAIVPSKYIGAAPGYDLRLSPSNVLPKYLAYCLLSSFVLENQIFLLKLRAAQPHINAEDLGGCLISLPESFEEQKAISDFLDRETQNIDLLIEKKQKLIELLQEKRQAIIDEAVTKGLDPNAPMKNSGIEWLSAVPAHWNVKKLKYTTSKIGSGKTPRGGAEVYSDSGVVFLRSQNVHFDGLRLDDVVFIDPSIDEEMSNTRVRPLDVLLNITGASLGRTCLVPEDCAPSNVNQHVCIIRPMKEHFEPIFLSLIMNSTYIQTQIFESENGVSREGLNFAQIANIVTILPSVDEQKYIADHLSKKTNTFNKLLFNLKKQIAKLQEYRQSLISEAVTGKVDVRHHGKEVMQ